MALGPAGVKFLVTEFDPSIPNDSSTGASSITDGTLWGGIYSAEYLMPFFGPCPLFSTPAHTRHRTGYTGVSSLSDQSGPVRKSRSSWYVHRHADPELRFLPFGAGGRIVRFERGHRRRRSGEQNHRVGGASVPATGVTAVSSPLRSQLYQRAGRHVPRGCEQERHGPSGHNSRQWHARNWRIPASVFTATDPSAVNSPASPNTIVLQTGASANPVTIPAYSIVRVDLKTPPVATFYNSASYQAGSGAPSALVTAFGSGFASQTLVDGAMPPVLGDTTITVTDATGNSLAAPIYYVSPSQASFLIPKAAMPGAATVKIARSGNTVLTGALTIAAVSPGIFTANANGAGVAAAVVLQSSAPETYALTFGCQAGVALSCLSSPISLGAATDTVSVELYGTGIRAAQRVEAFVAGQSVPVPFAGAQSQYQGLDQINISLPRTLAGSGEISVYIVADGETSNMVTIRIQ